MMRIVIFHIEWVQVNSSGKAIFEVASTLPFEINLVVVQTYLINFVYKKIVCIKTKLLSS